MAHVDINSAPDCEPFFFLSANKHVQSQPNFDAQLDLGIDTYTHYIKVSLSDINS